MAGDAELNPLIESMGRSTAARVLATLEGPEGPSPEQEHLPDIEGYVVLHRIGGGGAATVYQAVRSGSDRPLAIKLLDRRLGNQPEDQRAWRELDVLSQLRLSAVPRVVDYGIHDGRMYIVTEYIEGAALNRFCEGGKLDIRARVNLLAKVSDIVQELHERGIIHRDIKPKNVLVDAEGEPVVVDLGLASLITAGAAESITAEGVAVGTPAYMAPEQARGDRQAISTRSDVYALGATAYQVLTGQTPHDMDVSIHEAIRRVTQEPPRDPRTLSRSVDRTLARILLKSVSPRPRDRYASAAALAADLRRWVAGEPTEAGHTLLRQRVGRLVARHPFATTAVVCGAMATLTVVATFAVVWLTNARPYRMRVLEDDRQIEVRSFNDRLLHVWDSRFTHADSGFIKRPDALGGGRLAVVGFELLPKTTDFAGWLCAFDVDRSLHEPVWRKRIEKDDLPPPPPDDEYLSRHFGVTHVAVADYFPGDEGDEVLAVHQDCERSLCAIRIYDLTGDIRFETWHDGNLNTSWFLSEPGRVILSGVNGRETWHERSQPGVTTSHPYIVLALDIRPGYLDRSILSEERSSDPSILAWYRCLLPPERIDEVRGITDLAPPGVNYPSSSFLRICVTLMENREASVSWVIDADGNEVNGTRVPTTEYRSHEREGAPPHDLWRLGAVPPIVSPSEVTPGQRVSE